MLVKHHETLFHGKKKCKIFFPLCGKCVDMFWFASLGHEVVGVEGAKAAVEEFFTENNIEYTIRDATDFQVYEVAILILYSKIFKDEYITVL